MVASQETIKIKFEVKGYCDNIISRSGASLIRQFCNSGLIWLKWEHVYVVWAPILDL